MATIETIVSEALCTGCGGCAGICPTGAIEMTWNPAGFLCATIDNTKCTNCSLCRKVCPSVQENELLPVDCDPFYGKYLKGYIGYATDERIRLLSQSGGVVTALLWYMLSKKQIDSAIVNKFDVETQRSVPFVASSYDDLIAAAGSYYSQSAVMEKILAIRDRKTAVVMLGCQSESLNLVRKQRLNFSDPEIVIGLMCGGQHAVGLSKDLMHKANCGEKITEFRFRDKREGGWPGNIRVVANEKIYSLPKAHRHKLKPLYENYRCIMCFDQMNVYSDIVAGDPWGIEKDDNLKGNTVFFTRTEKGEQLIDSAFKDGFITVEEIPVSLIYKGQTVDNRLKLQVSHAVEVVQQKHWLAPYSPKELNLLKTNGKKDSSFKAVRDRLTFARTVYLADSNTEVLKLRTARTKKLHRDRVFGPYFNKVRKAVDHLIKSFAR